MRTRGPLIWGLILIVFGGLFLLDNLNVADFGDIISTFWPLILIVIGLAMLWRHREILKKKESDASLDSDTSSEIDYTNVFGDVNLDVTSRSFKGGRASTVFGDIVLDLTRASVAKGEQSLKVSTVFGNVRVNLPPKVAHSISGATLVGGLQIADQRKSGIAQQTYHVSQDYDRSAKKLRMDCSQVIGDLWVG